jgi:hypothetical protein
MTLLLRKLNLTAHVASSVAWLGAVAAFLALSIAGLTSRDPDVVRGVYISMNLIGQFVIVPLSAAAFATGAAQSVGTEIRAVPPLLAFAQTCPNHRFGPAVGATPVQSSGGSRESRGGSRVRNVARLRSACRSARVGRRSCRS